MLPPRQRVRAGLSARLHTYSRIQFSTMTKPTTPASQVLDRVLVLEMVRVTEAAAIAASKLVGRGDEEAADAAAVTTPSSTSSLKW